MKKSVGALLIVLAHWSGLIGQVVAEEADNSVQVETSKVVDRKTDAASKKAATERDLYLEVNSAHFVSFDEKLSDGDIFIPNPSIADVELINDHSLYISGKSCGTAPIIIYNAAGKAIFDRLIVVTPQISEIQKTVKQVFLDCSDDIKISSANGNIILTGKVPSPETASEVKDIVAKYVDAGKIVNRLSIETATQVMLKVKVAEVTRSVSKSLGVNWRSLSGGNGLNSGLFGFISGPDTASFPEFAADSDTMKTNLLSGAFKGAPGGGKWLLSNGTNNLSVLIDALANEKLAYVLAEPTLVALSGQSATFKSGGEQPYKSTSEGSSSSSTTTQFKEWGTMVEFTPVVLSENRINIKVKAEISSVDKSEGGSEPPLLTKNVETVVEMGSGQSLALAGLIQTDRSTSTTKNPILSQIPLLGALFRNSMPSVTEKEMVIIVTPYIVKPSSGKLRTPVDRVPRLFSPLDAIMTGKFYKATKLPPNAGYLMK